MSLEWLSSYLVPFISLSYPIKRPANLDSFPDSSYYGVGTLDACIVVTCIAVMAVLRDATRLGLTEPFARWKLTRDLMQAKGARRASNGSSPQRSVNGDGKPHGKVNGEALVEQLAISPKEARALHRSVLRFAEQGWEFVYYTAQWCFGLYVHINLPTSVLNPVEVWEEYPHFPLAAPVKLYYLMQVACYVHQVLILHAEARRKDHYQMLTHHVITIVLIVLSYMYNLTRIGCLIMVLMDWCDICLPLAKMLRYLGYTTACDAAFVWFMASWLVTRHACFLIVIWTTARAPEFIPFKWSHETGHYMTKQSWYMYLALLSGLQAIQIMWFWMICAVAWRVVKGDNAEDTRSDEEVDEDDDIKAKES